MTAATLQVVGGGLLGSSVGLAASGAGWTVFVRDADARAERLAADLGAGAPGWSPIEPELVVIAVPPSSFTAALTEVQSLFPQCTVSDVTSVKSVPQAEAERLAVADRFIGGHPIAGRERAGTGAARVDLFKARPWALCVGDKVDNQRVELVERMVRDCGADPVYVSAEEHDAAVGLISHLPQLVASGLAARLIAAPTSALEFAGQGLRDTVRIAASDPSLWADIAVANAQILEPLVSQVADDLNGVAVALGEIVGEADEEISRQTAKTIYDFVARGQQGYRRIPGKHGTAATEYAVVSVIIPDERGALARLLQAVADAGASVEDIALEHSPGHPLGIVELSVRPAESQPLLDALRDGGWTAH